MMDGHTPIPWKQEGSLVVVDSYGKIICDTEDSFNYSPKRYVTRAESKANARLIVHRVNTYPALVEALEDIVQMAKHLGEPEICLRAEAALEAIKEGR